MQELLSTAGHHNENARRRSIQGLRGLLGKHPAAASSHLPAIVNVLAGRLADADADVRADVLDLWSSCLLKQLAPPQLAPFLPLLLAHAGAAASSAALAVRLDALASVVMLAEHAGNTLAVEHATAAMHLFSGALSPVRMPSLMPRAERSRRQWRCLK